MDNFDLINDLLESVANSDPSGPTIDEYQAYSALLDLGFSDAWIDAQTQEIRQEEI